MHKFDSKKAQRSEIALIFGVHPSSVSRWKHAGCPCNDDGKTYNTLLVHRWLVEQATAELMDQASACDSPALERWREERAKIAEIQRRQLEVSVIEADQVYQQWALKIAEVCNGLENLANRLPPILDGKNRDEMAEIISDEIWNLRDNYCRSGRFCPADES